MALTTRIELKTKATLTDANDLATATDPLDLTDLFKWVDGTGADQADLLFHDTRTLAASAAEDLDLAGVLADTFGTTLTFARIKAILIRAASGNTNNVLVGGKSTNAFINWVADATDEIVVRPGGLFLLVAPDATAYAVTAATGDILEVTNSGAGTSVTYDVVLIGASA